MTGAWAWVVASAALVGVVALAGAERDSHHQPGPAVAPPLSQTPPTVGANRTDCTRLTTSLGAGDEGSEHVAMGVLFTNQDGPCDVSGYPSVTAIDTAGEAVATARPTPNGYMGGGITEGRASAVRLAHGQVASASLEGLIVDPDTGEQTCPTIVAFRVTLPGETIAVSTVQVTSPLTMCDLQVHPVVTGRGR